MRVEIPWIRQAKAFGILFIVAGHVAGGGVHLSHGPLAGLLRNAYTYFYSFHVPLFFFLAGLTYSIGGKGLVAFVSKKARRLLVPYFVFGLVSAAIFVLYADSVFSSLRESAQTSYYGTMRVTESKVIPFLALLHGGGWPGGNGFRPNSVLWFLACLFTLEVGYYFYETTVRIRSKHAYAVVLFILVGYISQANAWGFLPWGITMAVFHGAFFAMGRLVSSSQGFTSELGKGGQHTPFIAIILIMAGGYLALNNPDQSVLGQRFYWYLQYIITAYISISGWCLFSDAVRWRWLDIYGLNSMGLMLLHKFAVVFCQTKIPLIREQYDSPGVLRGIVVSVAITVFAAGICVVAANMLRRRAPWTLGQDNREKSRI